jgi:hypothetical protein
MGRGIGQGINYPNNDTLATAGTAQLVAAGAETTTFAVDVRFVTITYVDKDVWLAKTSAKAGTAAGGAADDRLLIKAGTTGLTLPWSGRDVYFVNATTGETPAIYLFGSA